MRISSRLASSFLCAAVAVGCGGSKTTPPGGPPASAVVGTSGGAVMSTDGNIAVSVPAGALGSNVTITVEAAATPAAGAVSTVYEIGPTGTQFAMPVTLTLHYDDAMLGGMSASSLRVATFAAGTWQLLPGATVDTQAKTVSGLTTHLSPYAIVAASAGRACAQIQAAPQCTGTGPLADAGASTGTPNNPGTGASGGTKTDGTSTSCTAPTCSGASNACSSYPGATLDGCTDGASGYTASCCFPSGGPICFAIGGAGGGCNLGPNGTGTCPPAPTCATASAACSAYPGATLQHCVDGPSGYTGACCFDPQSPVCISTGAARNCSVNGSCPPAPRCADGNPCAGVPGATTGSCTDTADGYQAACCFPLGTLPPPGGAPSADGHGGAGAVDAGAGPGTGGTTGSGTGASTGSGTAGTGSGTGATTGSGTAGTTQTDGGAGSGKGGTTGSGTGGTGSGTGATSGSGTAGTTQTDGGSGGITGGGTCEAGAACQPGSGGCANASPGGACMMCVCGDDGHLTCQPCPDKTDGGTGGTGAGGTTGGGTCEPDATCQPGSGGCANASPGGACMMCVCGDDGHLTCQPCPDKTDGGTGGTGAGGTTGGGTCEPGATCPPGSGGCASGSPDGACTMCMCGTDGLLTCMPCPDKADGGTPPPPDGGATASCEISTMPATGSGTPCGVTETCPNGGLYRVRCDGVSGQCMCTMGASSTGTITLSCDTLDPKAALTACKFPLQ